MTLRAAIVNMRSADGQSHGFVRIKEAYSRGHLMFDVDLHDVSPGLHGCHCHSSGNDSCGPAGLCSHYNTTGVQHGDLNDPQAHLGDFGNLHFNRDGVSKTSFVSNYLRYDDILGRSLVVHRDQDDLGLGPYEDSKTTGHSGPRILWGVIGIDEHCED